MKYVHFLLAWVFVALGFIGAFLPIMPTTPFLILAAYFFSKSSPKFHSWLLQIPWAGDGLRQWEQHKVIRPRAKIITVIMLSVTAILVVRFYQVKLFVKVAVLLTLLGAGLFVVSRKSSP